MRQKKRIGPPSRSTKPLRWVYFIEALGLGLVKIGCADDPKVRLATLQTGSAARLAYRGGYLSDDALELEWWWHQRFAKYRSHGEWFHVCDELRALMDDAFGLDEEVGKRLVISLKRQPRGSQMDGVNWRTALAKSEAGDNGDMAALVQRLNEVPDDARVLICV